MRETPDSPAPSHRTVPAPDRLRLEATVGELHLEGFEIEVSCLSQRLYDQFTQNPTLPGAILKRQGAFVGMMSRRQFLEILSGVYGRELFLQRSLAQLHECMPAQPLILAASTLISDAVQHCLARSPDEMYEPVVVQLADNSYKLLQVQTLLVSQAQIYKLAMETLDERNVALGRANLEISEKNQQMSQYLQQVNVLTDAAAAVENDAFDATSLDQVAERSDELGHLARVFSQMIQTVQLRERELEAAKDQLEAILNAVPGAISWIDSAGTYLGVNRHLAENWHLSQEAFVGQEIGFLKGSAQFAEFMREFIASPQEAASQVIEINGGTTTKYFLLAAQKYQQGTATVSVGIDVTDRKQAEEALRQSEARNRAFLKAIPDLILCLRTDGIYLDVVEAKQNILNATRENRIGKSIYDVLPAEIAQKYMKAIERAIATGETQAIEYQFSDGANVADFEGRVVRCGDDEVIFIIRDITDRKQAEEALRIAEENYRSIFENALEGIFQSSTDGRFLKVNPALARIYGYDSPAELVQSITSIDTQTYVDPNGRSEFKRVMEASNEVKNREYQIYRKDGSIIWIEENTRGVRDKAGKLLYYEGIVEDITERKQLEADLKQQLEELQIEIDQQKRQKDVAQITQSDYFQELKDELAGLEVDEFWR